MASDTVLFQNVSATLLRPAGIATLPGEVAEVPKEMADRVRKASTFRAGLLREVDRKPAKPGEGMPPARVVFTRDLAEDKAISLVKAERSLDLLQRMVAGEKRKAVLEATADQVTKLNA